MNTLSVAEGRFKLSTPQVWSRQVSTPYLEDVVMIFIEILSRIVSILVGVVTLAKECKSYIQRSKGRTVKDGQ